MVLRSTVLFCSFISKNLGYYGAILEQDNRRKTHSDLELITFLPFTDIGISQQVVLYLKENYISSHIRVNLCRSYVKHTVVSPAVLPFLSDTIYVFREVTNLSS